MITKKQATQDLRDLRVKIGNELQLARLNSGIDIDYVAFKLSSSQKRIIKIEEAKSANLNINELVQIAKFYGKRVCVGLF